MFTATARVKRKLSDALAQPDAGLTKAPTPTPDAASAALFGTPMWRALEAHRGKELKRETVRRNAKHVLEVLGRDRNTETGVETPPQPLPASHILWRDAAMGDSHKSYTSSHANVFCTLCWEEGERDFTFVENDEGACVCESCCSVADCATHQASYEQASHTCPMQTRQACPTQIWLAEIADCIKGIFANRVANADYQQCTSELFDAFERTLVQRKDAARQFCSPSTAAIVMVLLATTGTTARNLCR